MYVQSPPDKMAASEFSSLVSAQKETNRLDSHQHHRISYQGGQQMMYHPSLRGSMQPGLPSSYVGKKHQTKAAVQDLNDYQVGYPSGHHIVSRSSYQQGYQQTGQASFSPSHTLDQTQFRREPQNAINISHANARIHNQHSIHKSTHVFTQISDKQHIPTNYEQLQYVVQKETLRGKVHQVPQQERLNHLSSQDFHQNLRKSLIETSSAQAQMHLNYHHEGGVMSGSHGYLASTNRHMDSSEKQPANSHVPYNEIRRLGHDPRRAANKQLSTAADFHRVATDQNVGIIHSNMKAQQNNRQPTLFDNVLSTSIEKEQNRHSNPSKSGPQGQTMMYLNHVCSAQGASTSINVPQKESSVTHGSNQTSVPLDLSRVPEKISMESLARTTDSPLDLSIKTRKRCADTTIDTAGGIRSPKRQTSEPKIQLSPVNQHYRNHLQENMSSGLKGHSLAVYQTSSQNISNRYQTFASTKKEATTIKADNSAAKSSGLLPQLSSNFEQNRSTSFSQIQRQVNNFSIQSLKNVDLLPYPYSVYPSNPSPVVRCSPDSTNGPIQQQSNQHGQHMGYRRNTQGTIINQDQHNQRPHSVRSHSLKGVVNIKSDNNIQPSSQSYIYEPPIYSKSALQASHCVVSGRNLNSKEHDDPVSAIEDAEVKSISVQSKSEPHMQLYPSYDKQSLSGSLPSTCNTQNTKVRGQFLTPSIYKTQVKPPEIMGMPTVGNEKSIINTIQTIANIEDNKVSHVKKQPKNTSNEIVSKSTESDTNTCDKYMEPLSIAIPLTKNETNTTPKSANITEEKIQAPTAPKILSRKQMIMNAVIQDENLKKYATNIPQSMRKSRIISEFKAPRGSPSSPPSPKMPILSPQQKTIPSVSPLHSDPPTLDLLDNPSKQRMKGRMTHQIQKRALDKGKVLNVKTSTELQRQLSTICTEESTEPRYARPEALRRNSLPEKTWIYNKNIPVANVAPFVHSEAKQEPVPQSENSSNVQTTVVPDMVVKSEDVTFQLTQQKSDETIQTGTVVTVLKPKPVKLNTQKHSSDGPVEKKNLKNGSSRKKIALAKMKQNLVEKRNTNLKLVSRLQTHKMKNSENVRCVKKYVTKKMHTKERMPVYFENEEKQSEDQHNIDECGNLMSDPSLLDREERALRRAIDQFNKMESSPRYCQNSSNVQRISNMNKRAQELKRKAICRKTRQGLNNSTTLKRRTGLRPKYFIDFKPEVLKSRTRTIDKKQDHSMTKDNAPECKQKRHQISTTNEGNKQKQKSSDIYFENDEDYDIENDEGDDYSNDDDEDATEYEYDSDEINKKRTLRIRVSHSTRTRMFRHVILDDSDTGQDTLAYDDSLCKYQNTTTRPIRSVNQKRKIRSGSLKKYRLTVAGEDSTQHSEESTDDEFDAAFCHSGNREFCKIPSEVKKINVNKATGETGLHKAVRLNYQEAVLYYLQSGTIDVNVRDNAGYSPLHEACSSGNLLLTRKLLEHGADTNSSSQDGIRPLHEAVCRNHIEVTRLLLAYGGDLSVKNVKGETLLDISEVSSMNHFLKGFFVDLNGTDSDLDINPWLFSSSYDTGTTETGCNLFFDIPSDPENDVDVFDDDVCSAIRVFDIDLYNIGRSESYVYGEDIQSQFNCNETRLRKLCTPEMDVIKISTEKFQRFFENSVMRFPETNSTTIFLIKYSYYKSLRDKLTPTTKCSNVSELISYRNKVTKRKVQNKVETSHKIIEYPNRGCKNNTKLCDVKTMNSKDSKQNDVQHPKKSSKLSKSDCHNRGSTDSYVASASHNNNNNNISKNNNIKTRQTNVSASVQVVLKKNLLTTFDKNTTKINNMKLRTNCSLDNKSPSSTAISKYALVSEFDST